MKSMNNYEAPKAEMIELDVNKAFMQGLGDDDPSYPGFGSDSSNL